MAGEVAAALDEYFGRLMLVWLERRGTPPRVPEIDDVVIDPRFPLRFDNGFIEWTPTRQHGEGRVDPIDSWSVGLKELLGTYWFFTLGGRIDSYALEFDPVLPGWEAQILVKTANYRQLRPTGIEVPVGFETRSGNLLVVDPASSTLLIDDTESEELTPVKQPLAEVIRELTRSL